jgi:RHS repeat-associated protein
MRLWHVFLGSLTVLLAASSLAAQTPVLGSIEAPYPAVQSQVVIAGATYAAGSVAYGPAGSPLVLSGQDFGDSGTVQFVPYYKNQNNQEMSGTPVPASVTMWSPTILFLTVPSGASSGLVTITTEGRTSNGLPFMVTPGVYSGSCPASAPGSQLQILTGSLPNATVGQPYNATLSADGGKTAYSWSIANGALPAGLSLNASAGTISGTATTPAGPTDFTVQVKDSSSPQQTDDAVLTLTVDTQTNTASTIYAYSVGYDGVGNVKSYSDSTYNGGSIMGSWIYNYDYLNRLESGTASAGAFSGQNACWAYDAFGNRTAQTLQSGACAASESNVTPTASYSPNNEVTWTTVNSAVNGFTYDGAGNVLYDGANYYFYDAESRVCATQTNPISGGSAAYGYIYDVEGRRVAKGTITPSTNPLTQPLSCDPSANGFVLTESSVLGQSGEEITQLDGSGNWQRTNVYASGALIATYDTTGLHFNLADPLGTRRLQTNYAGLPEEECQSLPYGDRLYCYLDPNAPATADDATPLHFTGKERDTESGNDYFGARYYGSSMGRFMSPDPVFISAQRLMDPQSLNLYSYVRNNPLGLTDDSGLDFYLACQTSDHSGCGQVQNGSSSVWVQGQTVNGSFQAADVDMNKQGDSSAGYSDQFGNNYSGTFDQNNGVSFTNTATGATSGGSQFIDGSDPTQLSGSGAFSNITGNFFSDCGGSCQGRAALSGTAAAFAATESQLNKQGSVLTFLDRFSGAHPPGAQWKDSNGYVHMLQDPNGRMEMHFEGHPTGVDVQQFVLHMVDTIRDAASGRANQEKNTPLP